MLKRISEAARELGCSCEHLRRQIRLGRWPSYLIGTRQVRVDVDEIKNLLRLTVRAIEHGERERVPREEKFWRRGRDLNPRHPVGELDFESSAFNRARPPLRFKFHSLQIRPRQPLHPISHWFEAPSYFPGTAPPQSSLRKPLLSRFSTKVLSKSSSGFFLMLVPASRAICTDSSTVLAGMIILRLMSALA